MNRTFATTVPPAAAVLVACGRDPADQCASAVLRDALARVTDWEQLGDAALRHGMAGLLYRRVTDTCPAAVPAAVLAAWRERTIAVAQRSLRMQRQLLVQLERLAEAGVPALVLKGPAFSQQLYGDATLRHFIDLDVLVHPQDVAAAHDIALAGGLVDSHPFDAVYEPMLQTHMQEIVLTHPATGLVLEIHWRVGFRFAADSLLADELFARAGRLELLGREVAGLGPLDVVLVLTAHAATHGWVKLEDVAAVAAGLRRLSATDAGALEALAAASGCRRRLHVGILLAAILTQAPPPAGLAAPAFADRLAKDLAAWAGARLLWADADSAALDERDLLERVRGVLWQARTLDTPGATVRHLWRRLFTSMARDWVEGGAAPEVPRGAAATFLRRQRRLWRR